MAQSSGLSLPERRHVQDTRTENGFHAAEKEAPDPGTKRSAQSQGKGPRKRFFII